MLAIRAGNGWTESPASDFRRAEELVEEALAAAPRDYLAHYAKGSVLRFQGRCDQAIPEYERALESNPNWLNSLDFLAACQMMTGSMEAAICLEQQAIRLGPRDPYIGNFYGRIGQAHLLLTHTDEAIAWLEKATGAIPGYGVPHAWLASAYALKGETKRAALELAEARKLTSRYSSIARVKAAGTLGGRGYWGVPNCAPCSKPHISQACVRPGCLRDERRRSSLGGAASPLIPRGRVHGVLAKLVVYLPIAARALQGGVSFASSG